mgnify:CR=1 FL=1|jgi:hypothetical protein
MKKLKYWKTKLQNWYNTTEKRVSIETAKETILFNLLNELSTEESITLFNQVETIFTNKMNNRLLDKTKEKNILENFLN